MSLEDPQGRARWADDDRALTRLEQLLMRYPEVAPAETSEIGQRLRATGPLDMGLLSANPAAWAQAERYRADHPHLFRMSLANRLWLAALALAVVGSIIWLWDVAVP